MDENKIIMFLSNPFKPDLRVLREALLLSRIGISVTIIAWDREGHWKPIEVISNKIRVLRLKLLYTGRGSFLIRFLRRILYTTVFNIVAALYALRFLRAQKIKVIHCHDFDTLVAGFFMKLIAALRKIRVIIVFDSHEYWPGIPFLEANPALKRLVKLIHNMIVRLTDFVVTVSEDLKKKMPPPRRGIITVFPNIYLPSEIKELRSISEQYKGYGNAIKIFYFGGLHEARGVLQLVKLGILLKSRPLDKRVELMVAGRGSLERLVRLASDKGVVNYLGWIPEHRIREFLAQSDFTYILYDPRIENNRVAIPNKFYLSILYEVPIITNEGLYITRLVRKNNIGYVVNYLNAHQEIYNILAKICKDERIYKRLKDKVKRMSSELNKLVSEYASELLKLYDHIVVGKE